MQIKNSRQASKCLRKILIIVAVAILTIKDITINVVVEVAIILVLGVLIKTNTSVAVIEVECVDVEIAATLEAVVEVIFKTITLRDNITHHLPPTLIPIHALMMTLSLVFNPKIIVHKIIKTQKHN